MGHRQVVGDRGFQAFEVMSEKWVCTLEALGKALGIFKPGEMGSGTNRFVFGSENSLKVKGDRSH